MKLNHLYASICLIGALFLMSHSCDRTSSTTTTETDESVKSEKSNDIKPLSYTFDQDYKNLWKAVDSLQKNGLYKSGLDVVEKILVEAQKENNTPQIVKAVIHKMKFNSYMTEDEFVVALNELNDITGKANFPLKQIMHSITAETYWNYYQMNRWQFMGRSETVNFDNSDIRTWDLNKLAKHVNYHYMLSLSNEDSLQHTNIKDFKYILVSIENNDKQRPTLFDFLGHRALNFFENSEAGLSRPEEKYLIKGVDFFGTGKAFLDISTKSNDTLSNLLYATRIFQRLTKAHINDHSPEAIIDLSLRRLHFARTFSVEEKKDDLYIGALNKLAEDYANHEGYTEIRFACANYFNQSGDRYSITQPETQWDKKTALAICEEAIQRYPNSMGAQQCQGLTALIKNKNLHFNTEMAYAPNSKGKILVNYRNIDTLYFRLIKVNWDFYYTTDLYDQELVEFLSKKPISKSWSQQLKNPGDYQNHSTEIAIDVPELGQYALLASPNKDFEFEKNAIAYGSFWASNISYTYRYNDEEKIDVLVADRETGQPISNAKATIFERKYNYAKRSYEIKKQEVYHSDANGMFQIASNDDYRYVYIDIISGNDQYNNGSQIYQYQPYRDNKTSYITHFFTDRSIYRPGQTIHFKGIRLKHSNGNYSIEAGKSTTVTLYDANNQKVADVQLTSNEYGTFSGTFTAPTGLLNGYMRMSDKYGSKYFSVEEYKRPKFEVEFEPVAGEFKIGQQVKLTGLAKAFAGSSVDNAKVNFRISRSCSFPYWTYYRWGYYPYSQTTEIESGELKTDEKGNFIIVFLAKEDLSIDKKFFPNYSYSITADVTDINGETRSASQWLMVGYNCMNLSIGANGSIERDSKNRFRVSTTNLMGEKLNAKGQIEIHSLIEPKGTYRTSTWQKPDIQLYSKEEYHKLFPHDTYDNELDPTKYPKGNKVLSISFDTEKSDSVDFTGMNNWKPGRYVIESQSIDPFGELVKDIQYITIVDRKSTENATSEIWSFIPLKSYCEPGEKATFLIASASEKLRVFYEIEVKGKIVSKKYLTLNKGQQLIEIPIEEKHRGNISVHFTAIRHGRNYSTSHTVYVPYTNKELDVEFITMRNKLLPGSKEEWKVKIKGPKGEKVAAEMLATMYDASLDQFASNSFYMGVTDSYYTSRYWDSYCFGNTYSQLYSGNWNENAVIPSRAHDYLNWWGYRNYYGYYRNNYYFADNISRSFDGNAPIQQSFDMAESEVMMDEADAPKAGALSYTLATGSFDKDLSIGFEGTKTKNGEDREEAGNFLAGDTDNRQQMAKIQARSNLNETAFFFPQLETNEAGEVLLNFTMPEALTRWKFLAIAHTKDLKVGYLQDEIVTQKELMVTPNAPRFFREGDKMSFAAKVSNLSQEDLTGEAQLFFFDAVTMNPIDDLFSIKTPIVSFDCKKDQSAALSWDIEIPFGVGAVTYRVVAKAKNYTDGEEMAIPVLSNRMLVTETLPLPSKGIGTDEFQFTKLINSGSSNSIRHHRLTLEYTSNPAWYAVQAMPYMMEYPYECAEQIFTRYYANSLASNIMNSNPKIKGVFETWKTNSPAAFLSNLQKNQELKSLMLEETPWVMDAQNEAERKKRIGLLFDLNKMDNELHAAIRKLEKMQVSNGGWPWFPGMEESRYITQHVVTGMGHLDHLGVKNVREDNRVWSMVKKGVNYLDSRIIEDYEWLKAHDPNYLTSQRVSQIHIQYLYARSYFMDIEMNDRLNEAVNYYQKQAGEYWKNFSLYNEGMIALQAKRFEIPNVAEMVMKSIKERAILHDELGMYWKDNVAGYYWYQAPIETQALLIEAFDEVMNDNSSVEEMKIWLLKQKQTTDWKTTKATAEACYALFLRGTDLLANDEQVEIKINGNVHDPKAFGNDIEAGTGYFKTTWIGSDIKPEMGNVSVTRTTEGVSWGAMYWQYFEDLDKITTHETALKLNKKLFKVVLTESGEVITPVDESTELEPGDKVRVRIELRSDRNLEYVHMKDMRAAGFEPINVFSRYKYQDGLGYYESTKDAATNFFIEYLSKGTYVFEYDLRVSLAGNFSNGVTTIQCMYAPEFTSHSEGIRVNIEANK